MYTTNLSSARHSSGMTLRRKDEVLAVAFVQGYTHYADLAALVGEHRARVALERCVSNCRAFNTEVFSKATAIAASPYINPDQLEGVENVITMMCVEVLKTMHENHCFAADLPLQSWEFIAVQPCKLFLKPPTPAAAEMHPYIKAAPSGYSI